MNMMLINNECFRDDIKTLIYFFGKFFVTIWKFFGEFFFRKPSFIRTT